MGSINTTYDLPKDLTLVRAKGGITVKDFITWGAKYTTGTVTALVLWDLLGADLCNLSSDEIRMIATRAKGIAYVRKRGKVALVFGKPCDFGIGRMLEAYNETAEISSEIRAFRTIDDAKKWLGV
jgi:hypothetical protein